MHHPCLSSFKCLACGERFDTRPALDQHNAETGHRPIPCPVCAKNFGSPQALGFHTTMKHGPA